MKPRLANHGEFVLAGAIFLIGIYVLLKGGGYQLGTLSRMGPGYLPVLLGILIAAAGAALVWRAWRVPRTDVAAPIPLRDFLPVMAGLFAFALTAERLGFVPATAALIVLSSLGERPVRYGEIALTAAVTCLAGYLIFVYGLNVPLPAFRW